MNILKTVTEGSFLTVILGMLAVLGVSALLFFWHPYQKPKKPYQIAYVVMYCMLCAFCVCTAVWSWQKKAYQRTYIYTRIDDTVSFNEIYDNYTIVSEEDGVYKLGLK